MKQLITNKYKCINKFVLLLFCLIIFKVELFSQNPPAVEWQSVTWMREDIYDNYQSQVNSGEDWWYDHENVYNGSVQTGYIAVGYSSLILRSEADFNQAQLIFNEGPDSPQNNITHSYQEPQGSSTYIYRYDFSATLPVGCDDRNKLREYRTSTRGSMALNDLNGNMIWCKAFSMGELGGVVQDGNYFYIVGIHEGIKSFTYRTFLPYNGNPSQTFAAPASTIIGDPAGSTRTRHMYIAKIDMNGVVQWEGLYGMPIYGPPGNSFTAMITESYGYGIIKNSSGKLIATGYADAGGGFQPFILEVEPLDGSLINKNVLPLLPPSTLGFSCMSGESRAIVEIAGEYAIGCKYTFAGDYLTNTDDINNAAVWLVDAGLNPSTSWATNPIVLPGTGSDPIFPGKYNSNLWDLKFSIAKQELLVPVVSDCFSCAAAGDNRGIGLIYRYNADGTPKPGLPSSMGLVQAFDLRIGVEETSDGGFISISSQHTPGASPPLLFDPIYGYLVPCTDIVLSWPVWDTDALVVKYNSTGVEEWRKTFDIIPGRPREQPLGDLRQQECLYKVTETQDGGYVFSGNCSYNLDDNYLFKLYNDCSVKQVYTKTDPTDNIIDIVGSVTWSGAQAVLGSVNILTGATLTIAPGATIQFADSKLTGILTNINVQIGGKLIVSPGATLTSVVACPAAMWDGIIIQGTPGKQIAANQGWVVLSSCELKNARRGVFVGGIVKNSGGILHATSATFRNNYIDVEFMPYAAPLNAFGNEPKNSSFFTFCNFIGDAFLNDPIYTDAFLSIGGRLTSNNHVILRAVKGIGFAGNNFKTDLATLGSTYRTELRSIGIYSIDASFTVQRACNIIGPGGCAGLQNNFNNLFYGVYAQSSNPLKTFTVDQTNFTNCYYSLFQSGTNYSTVTKNNFVINTTIAAPIVPLCIGGPCINYFDYTNQCSGFTHSENNFTVTGGQQVIGSIFNNTGTSYKETYRNNYAGLKIGTQSQQTNGINATINGLQIKCNQNTGVITSDITSTSGVIPDQGSCANVISPASNEFSSSILAESDIKVSSPANNFIYSYQLLPSTGPQIPTQITTTKVGLNPCFTLNYIKSVSCPLPVVGCGVPCWFALAISNNDSKNNAKQVLLDGDAVALYNAINSNMSDGALKNFLISKSPYLSDRVLIAYLQRSNTPSSGNIKAVIIANSPLTVAVKAILDNLNLPNGIVNQINIAQVGISPRKEQEDLVDYYDGQKQLAIDASIRLLLNDTIISNTDSIIKRLLRFDGTIKSKTDLASLYINSGDYVSAQGLIDSVSVLPGMEKHGKMLQHNKNLRQANKDWFELNTDVQLKTDIEELSADSLADGFANARSIMAMVKGFKNYDVIEHLIEDRSSIINPDQPELNVIASSDNVMLHVYPNPFGDELFVNIDILKNIEADTYVQLIELVTAG